MVRLCLTLLFVILLQIHQQDNNSLADGIDAFYLIFAGALV